MAGLVYNAVLVFLFVGSVAYVGYDIHRNQSQMLKREKGYWVAVAFLFSYLGLAIYVLVVKFMGKSLFDVPDSSEA